MKYQQKHFQFRPQNAQVTMTVICNNLPAGEVSRWRNTIKTRRKTEIMFNSDAAWILSVHFIVESHSIIVFVSCVCCGWFRNHLCWYCDEITWVGWSRSWDCAAQLRYCVYLATALDIHTHCHRHYLKFELTLRSCSRIWICSQKQPNAFPGEQLADSWSRLAALDLLEVSAI